ncbi:NAD(P) transhydrogenase subunit alpha [Diaminobutyricibacter tongyongensis]|uniref:proton-translocating NAD(P)(+) transhydrogenase n=2 Tax=Leifsonia tongyongensis TaxID=1268043 RepID=A0A6L9XT52_9MICO|nr:NAD(P) transhydrogenase subunit alpha [Diaminobutyricibacter tongyongensis]
MERNGLEDLQACLTIGVLRETAPGERRVALDPDVAGEFLRDGHRVLIESGAGEQGGWTDAAYAAVGATSASRADVIERADVLAAVRRPPDDVTAALRDGQGLVGLLDPLQNLELMESLCRRGVTVAAFELLPRTLSRAQSMDALSSQSAAAGYRAAIVAAEAFGGFFPMMITAAGTARPARVLVIGAGVAGLQALSTARRLGAVVTGYDVRPASRGEVESVGASFATSSVAEGAGSGGYARAMTADELAAQQQELTQLVAKFDVVITTAKVPGRRPPVLVPQEALASLARGSVCVDLACGPLGGNVHGSVDGQRIVDSSGVTIIGSSDLAATIPTAASRMYAKNVHALVTTLTHEGRLDPDLDDELQRSVVVCRKGEIVSPSMRQAMAQSGPPISTPAPSQSQSPTESPSESQSEGVRS